MWIKRVSISSRQTHVTGGPSSSVLTFITQAYTCITRAVAIASTIHLTAVISPAKVAITLVVRGSRTVAILAIVIATRKKKQHIFKAYISYFKFKMFIERNFFLNVHIFNQLKLNIILLLSKLY